MCSAGTPVTVCDIAEPTPLIGRAAQQDCRRKHFAMARCCSPSHLKHGPAGASFVEAFAAAPASALEPLSTSRGGAAISKGDLHILRALSCSMGTPRRRMRQGRPQMA